MAAIIGTNTPSLSRKVRQAKEHPRFAVLGAGHGGLAMAAYLSLLGFPVKLWNRSEARIAPVQARGGILLSVGEAWSHLPHGFARMDTVTTNIEEAVRDAEIIMVVVPAYGHGFVAEQCAPHLRPGQVVVLNPGRTGGALEVWNIFGQHGVRADVCVAEAETFLFASRATGPAEARIFSMKNAVPLATIPAHHTPDALKTIRAAFPQFVAGDNVMKTGLGNIGAVFHPAVVVLNSARVEDKHGMFEFYISGITPSVARVLEAIDAERVAVSEALGFRAMTAREWLYIAYDAAGKNLYDSIRANAGYYGIMAPHSLAHRYLREDVPMSLVPIASLGEMLGVETPTIRNIIQLASLLNKEDYWEEGRTVERLGLAGLNVQQVRRLVLEGDLGELTADSGRETKEGA